MCSNHACIECKVKAGPYDSVVRDGQHLDMQAARCYILKFREKDDLIANLSNSDFCNEFACICLLYTSPSPRD